MTKKLFYYQGSNALNQKQKGSIIADTKQQAHFQLIKPRAYSHQITTKLAIWGKAQKFRNQ